MLVAYLKKNVAYGQDFVSTQFVIFCVPAVIRKKLINIFHSKLSFALKYKTH